MAVISHWPARGWTDEAANRQQAPSRVPLTVQVRRGDSPSRYFSGSLPGADSKALITQEDHMWNLDRMILIPGQPGPLLPGPGRLSEPASTPALPDSF
ncbi:hypothetical protein QTO34_009327 [Cnephaeus nilssonii]|uniref:Uncharacterized protein n=1 Tax=Cnephaeus nilssonii TaxID=3371016 RepID=A0AA40HHK0_CNENI|nr:hypothetical protein QTO34_009327 [Eptesicus nilssonii]